MAVERKFIQESMLKNSVTKFMEQELDRAGFASIDIQRTPMVTRINVEVLRPGKVIGRKGKTIKELTDVLQAEFGIDNPQIVVSECTSPMLRPRIVAKRACKLLEMGKKVRPVLHSLLREIMVNGALGAEIVASGKLAGKGGRAKRVRVGGGYMPKAGEPARDVLDDHYTAYPKPGAIGIHVRIVPPGTIFPDKATADIALPKVIAEAEKIENVPRGVPGEENEVKKDTGKALIKRRVRK